LIGIGVIFLALIALAVDVARFTGEFRSFDKGFPGSCAVVPLGGSSADIQIDRERGIAYLSFLNRASLGQGDTGNGTIMLLDLNLPEPSALAAMAYDPDDFRPYGLSLFKHAAQAPRLFAISHRPDGSQTVEIAEAGAGGEFFPKETIRNPAFVHPNAIAAVGSRQFYLATDSGAGGKLGRATEVLFRRGLSTLIYYDGAEAHVVATGLKFPAGLALSPDASRLYVAEALAQQLRVYRRDLASGAITPEETVSLDTAPDNLNVDSDGVVWIAAHPRLLSFFEHLRDPKRQAPTQVLRFDPRGLKPAGGEKDSRLSQVFANDGAQISAGSVAAHWHDEFLIGALLDHKVMICKPSP
jgi:arylesterase/paraoxonase